MQKVFIVFISVLFFFSCTQLCNFGRNGADKIAKGMANRWKCDYQLVYDDLVAPVDKYICQSQDKFTVPGALASAICGVAMEFLAKYTAAVLQEKYKCDATLVEKDLKYAGSLCGLFNLM